MGGNPKARIDLRGRALLLSALLFAPAATATEVDSFTVRGDEVSDVTQLVNAETRWRITAAVDRANRVSSDCDRDVLLRSLGQTLRANVLGAFMVSPLEFYANYSPDVSGVRIRKADSIYRNVWFYESVPITFYPLGEVIRVNDVVIGGDKFSHFFNVGWEYYRRAQREGGSVEQALDFGTGSEQGIWGQATTGVFSWADLASNFDGMRFWARVTGEPDALGDDAQPYVRCEAGEWVEAAQFSWEEWVTDAWDEGINCNSYAQRLEGAIEAAMEEASSDEYVFSCPVEPLACEAISTNYHPYTERLISPECRSYQRNLAEVSQ